MHFYSDAGNIKSFCRLPLTEALYWHLLGVKISIKVANQHGGGGILWITVAVAAAPLCHIAPHTYSATHHTCAPTVATLLWPPTHSHRSESPGQINIPMRCSAQRTPLQRQIALGMLCPWFAQTSANVGELSVEVGNSNCVPSNVDPCLVDLLAPTVGL